MRGYKAVGPVKANHVCVRDDRAPATPVAPAPPVTPATPAAPARPEPPAPGKPYYPAPPDTKPEPLPEAKRLTAPGTALGEADKKNNGVAEWYLTNFRVRFAREASAAPRCAACRAKVLRRRVRTCRRGARRGACRGARTCFLLAT